MGATNMKISLGGNADRIIKGNYSFDDMFNVKAKVEPEDSMRRLDISIPSETQNVGAGFGISIFLNLNVYYRYWRQHKFQWTSWRWSWRWSWS